MRHVFSKMYLAFVAFFVGVQDQIIKSTASFALNRFQAVKSPTFLALHGSVLYALSELDNGGITSIDVESGLVLDTAPVNGGPCHLAVNANATLVGLAGYGGGSVTFYHLDPLHPGRFGGLAYAESFAPQSHPHEIVFAQDLVYAPDLGLDMVHIYNVSNPHQFLFLPPLKLPASSGPRHLVFSADATRLFVLCELTSTIVVFRGSHSHGWSLVSSALLATSPVRGAAELVLSADEKHLYASQRVVDGSSNPGYIVHFSVQDTLLTKLGTTMLPGQVPRHFTLNGSKMYVLLQDKSFMTVFDVDDNGQLEHPINHDIGPSAQCLVFQPDNK
ncbi:hypothetical protein HDU91_005472 [Kappamyces sp. JEL0680]|nr:hypothetical protein HDU91_005472 [Kappamyces sp. JEL0680]